MMKKRSRLLLDGQFLLKPLDMREFSFSEFFRKQDGPHLRIDSEHEMFPLITRAENTSQRRKPVTLLRFLIQENSSDSEILLELPRKTVLLNPYEIAAAFKMHIEDAVDMFSMTNLDTLYGDCFTVRTHYGAAHKLRNVDMFLLPNLMYLLPGSHVFVGMK